MTFVRSRRTWRAVGWGLALTLLASCAASGGGEDADRAPRTSTTADQESTTTERAEGSTPEGPSPCDEDQLGDDGWPASVTWDSSCLSAALDFVERSTGALDANVSGRDRGSCSLQVRELDRMYSLLDGWPDEATTWFVEGMAPIANGAQACREGSFEPPAGLDEAEAAWDCFVLRVDEDHESVYDAARVSQAEEAGRECEPASAPPDLPTEADYAPADRMCAADQAWLELEGQAYQADDAGDGAEADRLIAEDVREAFEEWSEALEGIGLAQDVAPYVAFVQTWFDAAATTGIDGYDDASGADIDAEVDAGRDRIDEWITLNC